MQQYLAARILYSNFKKGVSPNSSMPEDVRTQVRNPKRRKRKSSRRLCRRMDWETHPALSPNPRDETFSKVW